jgi:hypothetical protein
MSLAQNTPDFDGAHQVEELSHSMSWRSGQNYELCLRNDGIHLPEEHPIHDALNPLCPRLGWCLHFCRLSCCARYSLCRKESNIRNSFVIVHPA